MFYKEPYYYLFMNIGLCCFYDKFTSIIVTRSLSPTGPFLDHLDDEILSNNMAGKQFLPGEIEDLGNNPHSVGINNYKGYDWASFSYFDEDKTERLGAYQIEWVNQWPEITDIPFV